jgi:hypothetical protein
LGSAVVSGGIHTERKAMKRSSMKHSSYDSGDDNDSDGDIGVTITGRRHLIISGIAAKAMKNIGEIGCVNVMAYVRHVIATEPKFKGRDVHEGNALARAIDLALIDGLTVESPTVEHLWERLAGIVGAAVLGDSSYAMALQKQQSVLPLKGADLITWHKTSAVFAKKEKKDKKPHRGGGRGRGGDYNNRGGGAAASKSAVTTTKSK